MSTIAAKVFHLELLLYRAGKDCIQSESTPTELLQHSLGVNRSRPVFISDHCWPANEIGELVRSFALSQTITHSGGWLALVHWVWHADHCGPVWRAEKPASMTLHMLHLYIIHEGKTNTVWHSANLANGWFILPDKCL